MLQHLTPNRTSARGGYSVLELLIVLGIIALLSAVVAPRLIGYLGRAKSQTASMQMDNLKSAIQLFRIDVGRYPTEGEGLRALLEKQADTARWDGPYVDSDEALIDPWDRDYMYRANSETQGFEIQSLGRDGKEGGDGEDVDLRR